MVSDPGVPLNAAPAAGGVTGAVFAEMFKIGSGVDLEHSPRLPRRVVDTLVADAAELPIVVIACDLEGRVTHWSRSARLLFGFAGEEVLGHPMDALDLELASADDADRLKDRLAGMLNWRGEVAVRGRYGNELHLHCLSTPIADDAGVVCGMAGFFLDVTGFRADLTHQAATLREMVFYGEEIRELERARIARDLHDDLGQRITAIKSEALQRIARDELSEVVREAGERLVVACDDLIDGIHRICAELTTPVLDDFGIQDALESLLLEVAEHIDARCSVDFGDIPPMDKRLRREVYRIGQQALVNVERHSKAKHISVSLRCVHETLVLEVADDGVGIEQISADDFGMQTMRERAERMAGSLRIHRNSPQGTVVRFALPLSQFNASPGDRRVVSRSFVEAIMRATGDITIVFNPDGTLQWIKAWSPIEAPGMWVDSLESMMALVHPDDRNLAFSKLMDLLTGASPAERWVTLRIRDTDGTYRSYEADGRNLVAVPEVGGVVVSLREVADRLVRSPEGLDAQRYYETLGRHLPVAMGLLSGDGVLEFANAPLAELLEVDPSELAGATIFDFLFERDLAATRERLNRRRLGLADMYPTRIRTRTGASVEVIVSASAHMTEGELDFVVITLAPVRDH